MRICEKYLFCTLIGLFLFSINGFSQNTDASLDQRVEELLAKMTLEEKMGQLNQLPGDIQTGTRVKNDPLAKRIRAGEVGSILSHTNFDNKMKLQKEAVKNSRLGIPLLFGFDVIHGYKTVFPIPLAQAATWDMGLIEKTERIAATEAAADGQHWTFAPMVDIARDPRWGRCMEGSGEDPFLGAAVAAARVKGIQGDDLYATNTIAACVKHFAAYGAAEGGRDYNTVDMSEQTLRNVYLPPYKAAIDAGAATLMNAFNTLNGVPCTMNDKLTTDILRKEWGFKGMIVSDWNSVGETMVHGAAVDEADATAKCLPNCDMDMAGETYMKGMKIALRNGTVTEQQINDAVHRVLRLKFELGLFDDPYRYMNAARKDETLEKAEHREFAREIAAKSMVLLKNDGGILPLKENSTFKRILFIGPYADSREHKDYMSFWTLGIGKDATDYDTSKVVTPAMAAGPALENMGFEVTTKEICINATCTEKDYVTMINSVAESDLVVVCVGERGMECGESRSVSDLKLNRNQNNILNTLGRLGKPYVAVLFNSRPLEMEELFENATAVVCAWQPGYEAGNALMDVMTGKVNPSAKLPMTWPRIQGQIPMYYNHLNTGRPQLKFPTLWTSGYLDIENTPAFPFGYGLSYTKFDYADLRVSKSNMKMGESVEVSVSVKNIGELAGDEVVQLYIRDVKADISRPVKELKGFEKISLNKGEAKTVRFTLTTEDLSYWNHNNEFKADPGRFEVFVGGNSRDVLQGDFNLMK